jgi:hypothetical protein
MDRPSLGNLIRLKLNNGSLPAKPPRNKIYAGYGSGAVCDACGDSIQPSDVEYELNYPDEQRTFRLHLGCASLWEAARLSRGFEPAL